MKDENPKLQKVAGKSFRKFKNTRFFALFSLCLLFLSVPFRRQNPPTSSEQAQAQAIIKTQTVKQTPLRLLQTTTTNSSCTILYLALPKINFFA